MIYGPIDLSEGLMFLLDLKVTFPMNNRNLPFSFLPSVMITREVRSCRRRRRRLHHDTIVAVLALI